MHRLFILVALTLMMTMASAHAAGLLAGAAKVDITNRDAGPVNDTLFVKALVLKQDATTFALITVDAVAIGEIGHIGNDYLPAVRARLESELQISPANVLVNASHCHGVVCTEVEDRTVEAVRSAVAQLVPVRIGAGAGREDRVSENRRYTLTNGRQADSRHAYSMPADEEVAAVGPIDPEIGLLRLDRMDGTTLAVVYNFACHPIQGVPGHGNTADLIGFASKVIEDNLGEGAVALFVQGCAGDLNPAGYKDVDHPRDAEVLGNMLGLSALQAIRKITCKEDDRLILRQEMLALPRVAAAERIAAMEAELAQLLASLQGTSLNLKTFLPLYVKYKLSEEYPSAYKHRYLHEEVLGRKDLLNLDEENRRNLDAYLANILTMEKITRLQTNLALLRKHEADRRASGSNTMQVELLALRIGDFVLTTFPGELTVQIGLNIKQAAPHELTFVAGYTNCYIYYAPTAEQLCNIGGAQEDSDCIVAPEWQALYESKAAEMLAGL